MQTLRNDTAVPGLPAELAAGRRCQETLLSCYCREVAAPTGHLRVGPPVGQCDWPATLAMAVQREQGQVLQVHLQHVRDRLLTVVSDASITGNYRFRSPVFHKAENKPWALLDWEELAALLLREMALQNDLPPNIELMEQIRNSVAVNTRVLGLPVPSRIPDDPVEAYIDSEQSLTFGHPFHPAPKSRQGFSDEDLARYSPELRTRFPLAWFAVPREDVAQQSLLAASCAALICANAPAVAGERVAVPVHPWQAGYLRRHPLVRQALASGRVQDLGTQGPDFFPTSSIRTLYQPGNPYFYKLSLNIRITNCVRKNAWYELESALQVNRVLRPLLPELAREFPGLALMEEPAFLSVDLGDADIEHNREVIEGFGLILRQSVDTLRAPGTVPLLAGSLFGNHYYGEARTRELLGGLAARERCHPDAVTERWFSGYVEQLVHPVLHLFFAHGVVFEPHLQNVVLGLRHGWPAQLFLRDFEGVKLTPARHPAAAMPDISERARASLWYDEEQGWNRIAYCLFVNNLCEVVAQLGAGRPALAARLWSIVSHHLHVYQHRYGNAVSGRRVNALLAGSPFPAKTNLSNRFFKRADRASTYVPVTNPLPFAGTGAAWQ
ncbi:Siderophore synthetase component [Aromatoleum tolulyticum]|uniref:Siderophore synthetase component n=1 Tax=Aromatoleum tolulyticum TaxID=34027 RepID=A0A1N7BVZ8_9RHOO|nr:IucA/IucC family protein [Aromatoleum tolulyticum]SIR55541.1 Siderophore synthetase component [Aromatoleum tolulyticum]